MVTVLHCAMDTNPQPFLLEGEKASRKHKMYEQKLEGEHKQKRKITKFFFLDCVCYAESAAETGNKTWIDAETSDGIKFKVSLCIKEPPCISRLLVKMDDAVPNSPASTFDLSNGKRITIEALTSCYDAILLHTMLTDLTFPCLSDDYFLLKNDLQSPVISCLPKIPGGYGTNFGLLYQDGHYVVAVLKEDLPLTDETRIRSGYQTPKVLEGPFICTFSTLTNKWRSHRVSFPPNLTERSWETRKVLACGNKFWWVDLRCGLLSFDAHQEQLSLDFTPLPAGSVKENNESDSENDSEVSTVLEDRCVKISDGLPRYVQIFRKRHIFFDYGCKSSHCGDSVKIWTLRDGNWTKDYTLRFTNLWRDVTYSSRGLPKLVPAYPSIGPSDPFMVYFFVADGVYGAGRVVGVDMRTKKVKYCSKTRKGLLYMDGLHICEFSVAQERLMGSSVLPMGKRERATSMYLTGAKLNLSRPLLRFSSP